MWRVCNRAVPEGPRGIPGLSPAPAAQPREGGRVGLRSVFRDHQHHLRPKHAGAQHNGVATAVQCPLLHTKTDTADTDTDTDTQTQTHTHTHTHHTPTHYRHHPIAQSTLTSTNPSISILNLTMRMLNTNFRYDRMIPGRVSAPEWYVRTRDAEVVLR